ncbi:DNA modification methylase [Erythrobacter litoralis]|uniref:site-specific DNA-methyltransferase n=1 Tax=Erythrobacter litoralis TaxID=39960 RepID=UPI0005504000|nr:DNA methyltransferase [Erythrobacter litoralis]AOL22597.1 DNA modification methylase [Erythrobacter litoralis]
MNDLQIETLPPSDLKLDPANARTHSDKQIAQIATSIERFGFNNPILIDSSRKVVAGHGRLRAARILGLVSVPTIRLDHLTPAQVRAYAIADNRLAELAGWDREILAIELQGLLDTELEFEITDIGFEMAEIDLLLEPDDQDDAIDDQIPEPLAGMPQAKLGDLWQLGDHLLLCGDALDEVSYRRLLQDRKANVTFTDPPYNVPVQGHVSGLGKTRHREFVQASGEMSDAQFREFLSRSCQLMSRFSELGAIQFVCMDWRHIESLIEAGKSTRLELKNICVWVKPNGGMGSLYRSRHELVAVFKSGNARHRNNVQLGMHGRYRTNVWEYEGVNSFQRGRDEKLAMHPTVKPVAMVADAILDCSARKDIVLDPFCGSGSTIIAAERTGRRCRAIELDPIYVDVCLKRFWQVTGKVPINVETGNPFNVDEASEPSNATAWTKGALHG